MLGLFFKKEHFLAQFLNVGAQVAPYVTSRGWLAVSQPAQRVRYREIWPSARCVPRCAPACAYHAAFQSSFAARFANGHVVHLAGPWRTTGSWWSREARFAYDSFDIQTSDGTVSRLRLDYIHKTWHIDAVYD